MEKVCEVAADVVRCRHPVAALSFGCSATVEATTIDPLAALLMRACGSFAPRHRLYQFDNTPIAAPGGNALLVHQRNIIPLAVAKFHTEDDV